MLRYKSITIPELQSKSTHTKPTIGLRSCVRKRLKLLCVTPSYHELLCNEGNDVLNHPGYRVIIGHRDTLNSTLKIPYMVNAIGF